MILPIRTSIRPRRTPYVNYVLIAVNVAVFLLTYWPHRDIVAGQAVQRALREWAQQFMLTPVRPYLWQFITYAFLHGSLMHIIGNMYFLYLFGNNVNDKLGSVGYLCFYLAGAVFSGIGHAALNTNPVLGASGAVAAVTGAYLVLFPQTVITVAYWIFFIGTMELSALYFIAFKLIFWDNVFEPKFSPSSIAYGAHLAGYGFGIAAILALLATKLISHSQFDLWAMIKRWNRRRQYRQTVTDGYDPFSGRKSIKVKEVEKTPAQQIRSQITSLINQRNLAAAANLYLELVETDPEHVLARQHQLDIANQLMSMGRWDQSARAYEKFIANYSTYEYSEQVLLMLGVLYCRYLDQPDKARHYLKAAREKLTNEDQIKMCDAELAKLAD